MNCALKNLVDNARAGGQIVKENQMGTIVYHPYINWPIFSWATLGIPMGAMPSPVVPHVVLMSRIDPYLSEGEPWTKKSTAHYFCTIRTDM